MRAGDLKKRITFVREQRAPDGYGGMTTTWVTVATVWAAVWPMSAKELVAGQQVKGEITHKIRIRFRRDITTAMRITLQGRTFIILGPPININEQNSALELLCKEQK